MLPLLKALSFTTLLLLSSSGLYANDFRQGVHAEAENNVLGMMIGYSENGSKKPLFALYPNARDLDNARSDCHLIEGKKFKFGVIVVNNQGIKVAWVCHKYDDGNDFYQLAPATEAGINFIVNTFKKSKDMVKVEVGGISYYLDSKGFTKSWNSLGDKAL